MISDELTNEEMMSVFHQICKMSGQQLRQAKAWLDHESRLAAEEAELEHDRAVAQAMVETEAECARMRAECEDFIATAEKDLQNDLKDMKEAIK